MGDGGLLIYIFYLIGIKFCFLGPKESQVISSLWFPVTELGICLYHLLLTYFTYICFIISSSISSNSSS
jgi:hypothetical protein